METIEFGMFLTGKSQEEAQKLYDEYYDKVKNQDETLQKHVIKNPVCCGVESLELEYYHQCKKCNKIIPGEL